MYEAACRYAEMGIAVVPMRRDNNHAAIRYKKKIAQAGGLSAAELKIHFPDDSVNIGALCGSASRGLMGLDLDTWTALKDFQNRFPKLAKSLPYAVSHKGWHFFFLAPEGERQTRSYHVGNKKRGAICHIKGENNTITLDPSWRPSPKNPNVRREYRWINPLPASLASLPTISPQTLLPGLTLAACTGISSYQHDAFGGCDVLGPKAWLSAHAAAVRYQPWGRSTRSEALFQLVRFLRGLFGDAVAVTDLREVFAHWHVLIQGKSYVEQKGYKPNWRQFCEGWSQVRLDNRQALAQLLAGYQPDPEASAETRLWGVCLALSVWSPTREFYLAGETAGQLVGCNQSYASRTLREFCADGRLRVTAKFNPYKRIAKTYQVIQGGS